jgi:hypothetical protein
LKLSDPIVKLDPLDDLGQSILTFELTPVRLSGHYQIEGHGQTGRTA